jgi:RNA polymerase sigma-70 factor (ECF subfamily)
VSNFEPDISDLKLLEDISKGDDQAFKQLYHRYYSGVYNYILRLIHEERVSEEIFQEVFLAIWQSAGKFRRKSSVKTWIFRIAYFQSMSWLRKNRESEFLDEQNPFPDSGPSPEDFVVGQFESSQIISALENLSPKHRSVIELTFVHGFSYREIAETMKCPVGTVKSRMSYALKYMEAALKKNPDSRN